jgi:hypothetical protein
MNYVKQLEFKMEKNNNWGLRNMQDKLENLLHQQCPHLPGHRQRCLRGQFDIEGLGKCVVAGRLLNFRFRSLDHHILRRPSMSNCPRRHL